MTMEKIYFQRTDGKPCDIFDVMNILGNCSKLEESALSSEAKFNAKVENGLALLSYYLNFLGLKKMIY